VDAYQRSLECLVLDAGQYKVDQVGREADQLAPSAFPGLAIRLPMVWGPTS
jgi:hypothetical protein